MNEFPASAATQVTLANWRTHPFNQWSFHHVRELIPTADIPAGAPGLHPWTAAPADLSAITVDMPSGPIAFGQWQADTATDGLVVAHKGRIVHESYANGMGPGTPHILMSVSKSMLGLLAGILAARGTLDIARPVTDYIPEVRDTAFRDATIRNLLDMRVGVAFDEDYLATTGPIIAYRRAQGWNPALPGEPPSDLRSFFTTLVATDGRHATRFHYVSPCTDLLGWVIERAAGQRYADLMSELLWQPMGAETNAYITVDRLGAPRAAGGQCTTTRDLARVGQIVLDGGRGIVPADWIEDMWSNGDSDAWAVGSFTAYYPGRRMHYRSKWYVEHGDAPLLFCLGVFGQNLFVDRQNQIVIAKFSSQAPPLDAGLIDATARGVAAIRRALR
ncbi:MAG: serine hydrolase domain-containing protein [Hyphomicrobiaceae bacterium]